MQIAQDICNKVGIELATTDFRSYDKRISWYDNTVTARQYIGYIAELNGGYAQIGQDGKLYFLKHKMLSQKTISIDECSDFTIGEKHQIGRVVYELGALKYEFGEGESLYLDDSNPFITEESEVQGIYNDIEGFTFYSFKTENCPIDFNIMAGQIITFDDGENLYPTVAQYDLTYYGGWNGGYSLEVSTEKQTETAVVGPEKKIKNLKVIVDRAENSIKQIAEEQTEQSQKISEQQQTIDRISSKVEDVEDLTKTIEGNKSVDLKDCVAGNLLELHIYGNNQVFRHLYVSDELIVSDDLVLCGDSRIRVYFPIEEGSEEMDWKTYDLGVTDVLRQNNETRDEYVLKDGKAQVIRRVNSDGTTKAYEEIEDLGEFSIPLKQGENIIVIQNYTARIKAKYVEKNGYTDIFASKVEMKSSITQTAEEINLEVSKKVDGNEIISKINQSAEQISIEAEKLNINGVISANGNFKVDTNGNMTCNNAKVVGGKIELKDGTGGNPNFTIKSTSNSDEAYVTPSQISVGNGSNYFAFTSENGWFAIGSQGNGSISLSPGSNAIFEMFVDNAYVVGGAMHANAYHYDSLKELKKNIKKYEENAIDIVKKADLYKFNYKSESEETKQHVGFIIGEEFSTPDIIISNDGKGINSYSMTSVAWKAIQEQQEIIENLLTRIEKLEKGEK